MLPWKITVTEKMCICISEVFLHTVHPMLHQAVTGHHFNSTGVSHHVRLMETLCCYLYLKLLNGKQPKYQQQKDRKKKDTILPNGL